MSKKVLLPHYIDDYNSTSDYWYPHPPCLIPLFVGHGASYKGVVKHFFCERESTFVEYFSENGYLSEIARNADQFLTLIVLKMILTKDGLTDEIIKFCDAIDFREYNAVDKFTLEYGDDPKDFDHLVFFKNRMPFKFIKDLDEYDGDFPSSIYILNNDTYLRSSSYVEIAPVEKLLEVEHLSPWLKQSEDKKDLFDFYIRNGNLKEAWLTLNSKNLLLKDVAEGLKKLSLKANDESFSIVANHWIAGWKKSTFSDGQYY
jgi:hypothetical protein